MSFSKLSFLSLSTEVIQLIAVDLEDEVSRATLAFANAELRSILLLSCQPHVAMYAAIISLDPKLIYLALSIFGKKVVPKALRYAANLEHPAWGPPGVLEPVYAMSRLISNHMIDFFIIINEIYNNKVGTAYYSDCELIRRGVSCDRIRNRDVDSWERQYDDPEDYDEDCHNWMFDALKTAIDTDHDLVIEELQQNISDEMTLGLIHYCFQNRRIEWARFLMEECRQAVGSIDTRGWAAKLCITFPVTYLPESILSSNEKMFTLLYKYHKLARRATPTTVMTEDKTRIPAVMWLAQWGLANHFSHPGTLGIWKGLVGELWGHKHQILQDDNGKSVLHHLAENGATAYGRKRTADDSTLSINETYRQMLPMIQFPFLKNVINSQDNDGRTPLHIAVANEEHIMVKWLIANRANCNATDDNGLMPWDPESYNNNERCKWIAKDVYEMGLNQLNYPLIDYKNAVRVRATIRWRMLALDLQAEWLSTLETDDESELESNVDPENETKVEDAMVLDSGTEPDCVSEMDWYPDIDVKWASEEEEEEA